MESSLLTKASLLLHILCTVKQQFPTRQAMRNMYGDMKVYQKAGRFCKREKRQTVRNIKAINSFESIPTAALGAEASLLKIVKWVSLKITLLYFSYCASSCRSRIGYQWTEQMFIDESEAGILCKCVLWTLSLEKWSVGTRIAGDEADSSFWLNDSSWWTPKYIAND